MGMLAFVTKNTHTHTLVIIEATPTATQYYKKYLYILNIMIFTTLKRGGYTHRVYHFTFKKGTKKKGYINTKVSNQKGKKGDTTVVTWKRGMYLWAVVTFLCCYVRGGRYTMATYNTLSQKNTHNTESTPTIYLYRREYEKSFGIGARG